MDFPVKESGIWFSAVLKHIRESVICVDPAGQIIWMNTAAQQLIGKQEIASTGRRIDAVFSSLERNSRNPIIGSLQTVLDSGVSRRESRRTFFCSGTRSVRVDYTIVPVSQGGECRGAVIIFSQHLTDSDSDTGARLKESGQKPVRPQKGGARVLVMDDDDVVRNLTVQKLIRLGYDSEGALNGEEAVSKFQSAKDSGKSFDVVVLDLIVRGGMGGKRTLEMLQDVDPGVKAILTSGHAVDPILTNFWEYGFFGVIRKPFVIKELDVAIRQAVEER